MNVTRRQFLSTLLGISAATVGTATVNTHAASADAKPHDAAANIRMVKKQTRAARQSELYPTRQARYAADSRIYSLYWRSNGRLIALADRPAIQYPTVQDAWNVAIANTLFVSGNCVIAREFPTKG